jgi:RsiW-degrading membrane proteinase PrsW (M82 family)
MVILLLLALVVLGIELAFHIHGQFVHGELAQVAGAPVRGGRRGWSLTARLWLFCGVGGSLWLVMLNSQFHTGALVVAVILAVLPVPIHITLIHWLDRMEPEPPKLVIGAFLWGATIATVASALCNDLGSLIAGAFLNDNSAAKTLITTRFGPIVEETAKGIALLALFRIKREEFDDIVDGIVYAAMVGLGFAMSENVLYYGREFSSHGAEGLAFVFGMRGVISPYAHPLFTSMTGIGLGIAAQTRKTWVKWLAPLLGFGGAVLLHALWNTGSTAGLPGFALIYVFVMVPVLVLVLVLLARSIRREARILREQLAPDLREGRLSQEQYEDICAVSTGLRSGWKRLRETDGAHGCNTANCNSLPKNLHFIATALPRAENNPILSQSRAKPPIWHTSPRCAALLLSLRRSSKTTPRFRPRLAAHRLRTYVFSA